MDRTYYEITISLFDSLKEGYTWDTYIQECHKILGDNPTFKNFCESEVYNKHPISDLFDQGPQYVHSLFHLYCMRAQKDPIYEVEERLARDLAKTSLDLDTYFLRSPFPEVCLVIPSGILEIMDFTTGKVCPVTNIYVNLQDIDGEKHVTVFSTYVHFNGEGIAYDDITFFFNLHLGAGKLQDALQKAFDKMMWSNDESSRKWGEKKMREVFGFVFNTLIYLTNKNAEICSMLPQVRDLEKKLTGVKNPKKRRRIQKILNKETKQGYRIVTAKSAYSEAGIKSARARHSVKGLSKLVKVEAHWHKYWYGKRTDDQGNQQKGGRVEVKWLATYEKGHGESVFQTRRKVV